MQPVPLPANVPKLVGNFGNEATAVYIRVNGAANVHIASRREDLETSINTQVLAGIPQAQPDGNVEYFVSGEVWAIADAPNTFLQIWAPQFEFNISRGVAAPLL